MQRCAACRRPLTNPVSIRHKLGPDCLKKAVADGNAPLEALEQLSQWKRSRPKQSRPAPPHAAASLHTTDLFAAVRAAAIKTLHLAADDCRRHGVKLTLEIIES